MRPTFQADANLNQNIITGILREVPEIDFQTADAAALRGLRDELVLEAAAAEGRILVTHDRRTIPLHFANFISTNVCPGVLVVSNQASIRTVIESIVLIWSASDAEEYINSIRQIPF